MQSTCVDSTQDLHMCVSCLKDDQPLNQQTHQLALSIVQLVSRLCNRQQFVFSSLTASLSTGSTLLYPVSLDLVGQLTSQQVSNALPEDPGRIAHDLTCITCITCVTQSMLV